LPCNRKDRRVNGPHARVVLAIAGAGDRETIFRLRHEVYARELGQHAVNPRGALSDDLDLPAESGSGIVYLVARSGGEIVGFVAVTPPTSAKYSIDKYVERARLPFAFDAGLFEIRLLTVVAARRSGLAAPALMYAALRWAESHGGTAVEALGRRELV
jgi:GNAT superfamily N-acetyltransferase